MSYGNTKIYNDGSHYIAIPYVPNPHKRRNRPPEEEITVREEEDTDNISPEAEDERPGEAEKAEPLVVTPENISDITEKKMTRKELFERLYGKYSNEKPWRRRKQIISAMLPYFKDSEHTVSFVDANIERKKRNLISRRVRLTRKVNLQRFNYFCTFTYDSGKHTEESFKKKLQNCFKKLCYRKGWKYAGVWERSPEKQRLHFHGLFYIPEGGMPGQIFEKNDYSFGTHRRQITHQNTYFNERFGRSDFEEIEDKRKLGSAVAYIIKYIEKTGEKIVYSKGLPQFFISDILDDDIVCRTGLEDKKLLLFDDFSCFDDGCYIGKISQEVIQRLRKGN